MCLAQVFYVLSVFTCLPTTSPCFSMEFDSLHISSLSAALNVCLLFFHPDLTPDCSLNWILILPLSFYCFFVSLLHTEKRIWKQVRLYSHLTVNCGREPEHRAQIFSITGLSAVLYFYIFPHMWYVFKYLSSPNSNFPGPFLRKLPLIHVGIVPLTVVGIVSGVSSTDVTSGAKHSSPFAWGQRCQLGTEKKSA